MPMAITERRCELNRGREECNPHDRKKEGVTSESDRGIDGRETFNLLLFDAYLKMIQGDEVQIDLDKFEATRLYRSSSHSL